MSENLWFCDVFKGYSNGTLKYGFLTFWRGIETKHWAKMVKGVCTYFFLVIYNSALYSTSYCVYMFQLKHSWSKMYEPYYLALCWSPFLLGSEIYCLPRLEILPWLFIFQRKSCLSFNIYQGVFYLYFPPLREEKIAVTWVRHMSCFARFDTICKTWKMWKKSHGKALLLVKLQHQPATLLKVTLLYECFSRFLNCTNGTKSGKVSHMSNR